MNIIRIKVKSALIIVYIFQDDSQDYETQDYDTQDYDTQDCDTQDTTDDTLVLFDSQSKESTPAKLERSLSADSITKMSASLLIKSVTGKVLGRDELVKLLRVKFQVQNKVLISLTASKLMQVLAKKLISSKYVLVNDSANYKNLKKSDLHVQKEIEI